jgi:PAS domain S-box-containing protein
MGIGTINTDITARKAAEEALKAREAQLRQAQQMARIGVFIWDDVEDRCIYCSDELAGLLGISVEEFVASRGSHESILLWIHPEDRAHYNSVVTGALEKAVSYDVEFRIYDAAGELWHWREQGEPELDARGRQVRSFGTVQDITAIRKTEDELRESERRYRELFEESPVAIWVEDWSPI